MWSDLGLLKFTPKGYRLVSTIWNILMRQNISKIINGEPCDISWRPVLSARLILFHFSKPRLCLERTIFWFVYNEHWPHLCCEAHEVQTVSDLECWANRRCDFSLAWCGDDEIALRFFCFYSPNDDKCIFAQTISAFLVEFYRSILQVMYVRVHM